MAHRVSIGGTSTWGIAAPGWFCRRSPSDRDPPGARARPGRAKWVGRLLGRRSDETSGRRRVGSSSFGRACGARRSTDPRPGTTDRGAGGPPWGSPTKVLSVLELAEGGFGQRMRSPATSEPGNPSAEKPEFGRARKRGKLRRARLGPGRLYQATVRAPTPAPGLSCEATPPYAQPSWLRIRTRWGSGRFAPPFMVISSKPSSYLASILLPSTPSGRLITRRK